MHNHRPVQTYRRRPSSRRSIAGRLRLALLAAVLAVSLSGVQEASAQGGTAAAQGTAAGVAAEHPGREYEGSHELSTFFLIGIMINIVALALFIAWAAREWKRKRPAGREEGQ